MIKQLTSGFYGIGIQHGKTPSNLGVLWRTAQNMGAQFIFTIGKRYKKQACDTHNAVKMIPYFHYENFDDFYIHLPKGAMLIAVELTDEAVELHAFKHPRQAVYLLGAEDHGVSKIALEQAHAVVKFNTPRSLNVAVAGSIVMYDRMVKGSIAYKSGKAM